MDAHSLALNPATWDPLWMVKLLKRFFLLYRDRAAAGIRDLILGCAMDVRKAGLAHMFCLHYALHIRGCAMDV